ncbi:hypothetical protein DFP73DRAFT_553375 [Morchella snyderi]|nr:hypothetical protein DFP73DRAFT_553375 [Morchella snyderi]
MGMGSLLLRILTFGGLGLEQPEPIKYEIHVSPMSHPLIHVLLLCITNLETYHFYVYSRCCLWKKRRRQKRRISTGGLAED